MLDIVIKNGKVIDGTGKSAPQELDIGIKDGSISEVGRLPNVKSAKVIDAGGNFVCPGFIDVQNHSDSYWTIFDYPGQESMLTQGITTIAVGQCGASLAPLPTLEGFKSIQKWRSPEGENINWQYFEEYLESLSRRKIGVNILSLVGHATLRRGLLKDEVRKVTDAELKVMQRLVTSSFKTGAFGLSFGLIYAHEYDAAKKELLTLAKAAGAHERVLSVHIRNSGSHVIEALDEALKLAQDSGARLKISHLKIEGPGNWHLAEQVISRIEQAHKNGIKVKFDVYPYTTSWPVLYTFLPKWAYEGGRNELNKRLAQPYLREKVISGLRELARDLSKVIIATASSAPHLIGRSLVEIALDQGTSVEEAMLNVLASSESEVVVFDENLSPENLEEFVKSPFSMIATNGAGFGLEKVKTKNLVHPRCFGAMPRFLSMILKNKWLTPEKAVYKITGAPAEYLGLKNRGVIKKRSIADITVFDPEKIRDHATVTNPYQISEGISTVVLGGRLAVSGGKVTGDRAGEILRAN